MRSLVVILGLSAILSCAAARSSGGHDEPRRGETEVAAEPAAAVEEISRLERRRAAADALRPYLSHPHDAVRARATLAMARVADPGGAAALTAALVDRSPEVRALAAFGLGVLDRELPLPAASDDTAVANDGSWVREASRIRADAERALGARLQVEEDSRVRRALYAALGQLATGPGLGPLSAGLGGGASEPELAALAYGVHAVRRGEEAHRGEEMIQRLLELGQSDDAGIRFGAVFALARHKAAEACPLFEERLVEDADVRVRTWAARGLGVCAGGGTALVKGLAEGDWRVRVEVLRSLLARERAGDAVDLDAVHLAALDAIDALRPFGGERDLSEGHVVAAALPLLRKPEQLSALVLRLEARAGEVGRGGRSALGPLRCALAVARAARVSDLALLSGCDDGGSSGVRVRLRELRALQWSAKERPSQITRLHPYLTDSDPRVRATAAQSIAAADDAASRALLSAQLSRETDAAVVEAIADAMAEWPRDATLVDGLVAALDRAEGRGDSAVVAARASLAAALATHGAEAAEERLSALVAADEIPVGNAVRRALGRRPRYGVARAFGPQPAQVAVPVRARVRTVRGDIQLRLLAAEAPEATANFIRLARTGFYDGLTFHRVSPGFVIQGGDPRGDGYGGPGYVIPCEVTPRPFKRGVVGMALAGVDTGGSQFFITQSRQPHLDGRYTAFGEVVSGWRTLDSIFPGDAILGIDIERVPPGSPVEERPVPSEKGE